VLWEISQLWKDLAFSDKRQTVKKKENAMSFDEGLGDRFTGAHQYLFAII
jgi:hypothetical protein